MHRAGYLSRNVGRLHEAFSLLVLGLWKVDLQHNRILPCSPERVLDWRAFHWLSFMYL